MLKKILLGASIVTATTKIVTDICEAYEEAEEKPKGLSIIPFVLQTLAKEGNDMTENAVISIKNKIDYVRYITGLSADDLQEKVNAKKCIGFAISAIGIAIGSTFFLSAKLDESRIS